MTDDLTMKPCPKPECGGEAIISGTASGAHKWGKCTKCGLEDNHYWHSHSEAIQGWNDPINREKFATHDDGQALVSWAMSQGRVRISRIRIG